MEKNASPLLDATSAGIADLVDRRRNGEPVFGEASSVRDAGNRTAPAQ